MTSHLYPSLTLPILKESITVTHNPFRGLEAHEVEDTIVLRKGMEQAQELIQAENKGIIELVGPKGRGKTTHLRYLHDQHDQAPIWFLHRDHDARELVEGTGSLVFIDSIHHLTLWQRIRVYQAYEKVVLTTHQARGWEYRLAQRPYHRFRFKGIEVALLQDILYRRLRLAALDPIAPSDIRQEAVKGLIRRFGDDYRAIVNHLYTQVQSTTHLA